MHCSNRQALNLTPFDPDSDSDPEFEIEIEIVCLKSIAEGNMLFNCWNHLQVACQKLHVIALPAPLCLDIHTGLGYHAARIIFP